MSGTVDIMLPDKLVQNRYLAELGGMDLTGDAGRYWQGGMAACLTPLLVFAKQSVADCNDCWVDDAERACMPLWEGGNPLSTEQLVLSSQLAPWGMLSPYMRCD